MSEETKKEQSLEEEVNVAQNESENQKEAQNSSESETLEVTASTAEVENDADETPKSELCTSLLGLTEDYIDPIPEEYIIERDNITRSQWFLFYYEAHKRTVTVNVFLGC
jgi:hypothetical protein